MLSTHASLLLRVRHPEDAHAWESFEQRYGSLLLAYSLRRGLSLPDAEDVRQDVLAAVARAMPSFSYDPAMGRFRDYLKAAARNAISRRASRSGHTPRPQRLPDDGALDPPDGAHDADTLWEEQWRRHHCALALDTLRRTESERNVEVFTMLLAGSDAREVALATGLSHDVVRKIKQRVRQRLHEILRRQFGDEDVPPPGREHPP